MLFLLIIFYHNKVVQSYEIDLSNPIILLNLQHKILMMTCPKTILTPSLRAALDSCLGRGGSVVIAVHIHPDGDALGSAIALKEYLSVSRGCCVSIVSGDNPPSSLDFLLDGERLVCDIAQVGESLEGARLLVSLDHNDFKRTGSLERVLRGATCKKLLIDHHPEPSQSDYSLVFSCPEMSSTCELLYYLLVGLDDVRSAEALPARCRQALYTGMTTDTNNFANSVLPSTLQMASQLMEAGVDRDAILSHLYNSYPERRFRAMGYMLSDLMHITPQGVAYAVLDSATLERFGLEDGDTEGFVNLPLGIDKVFMSVLLKQDNGFFRVSVRSKRGYSASRLCSGYFHGGGHEQASGGRLYIPEDIPDAGKAAEYIETMTARFLQEAPAGEK